VGSEPVKVTGQRVARRIRELRLERALTLADLATRLARFDRSYTLSTLSRIEQGKRRVDADDLVAIALALDVPPNAILFPADEHRETRTKLTANLEVDTAEVLRWAGSGATAGLNGPGRSVLHLGSVHRSILAVDIEGSVERPNLVKMELRRALYGLLDEALQAAGIAREYLEPLIDRGDGVLILVRPHDDVPKNVLLDQMVPMLAALLIEHNTKVSHEEFRLRLRAAVHAGEIYHDGNGFFGEDLDVAFRLLDSPATKRIQRDAATPPVLLVVSDTVFSGVVGHDPTDKPPVRINVAGQSRHGWIQFPTPIDPYQIPVVRQSEASTLIPDNGPPNGGHQDASLGSKLGTHAIMPAPGGRGDFPAFGIDLGTTHSYIAHIGDAGRPVIIKSALGDDDTPSVVYFETPQNVIVGRAAKNAALLAPDLTVQLVKRDMGRPKEYRFHGERHTPETISALILRELARTAEEHTGQPVRDVVITVPAYFAVAEREATRRAGQIAGLNVLDVLAEPVAATLNYQSATGGSPAGARHILVCDLGGGTFDTTVIRLEGDDTTVVCTDGDDRLGGADWDTAIADYLIDQFEAKHPGSKPRDDPQFMQDVLISAEQLKKDLSQARSRRHVMRFGEAVVQVELTRDQMDELTASLLARIAEVTGRTISTARARGVGQLDEVLLVGGMTRTPAVAATLKDRLGLEARPHEPDLTVAKGAALFALMRLARQKDGQPGDLADVAAQTGLTVLQVEKIASKRVATVVPRGFGVKGIDGRDPLAVTDPAAARQIVVHLLAANTQLPADTGPYTFHTAIDNQRIVSIEVWEQVGPIESGDLSDNRKIGEGLLKLPPRLPASTPIEVTFFMSETGLLTIHATEPGSGIELRSDFQIGSLDQAGIESARKSVAHYHLSD
jgi:molecular chaperone DnaK